MNVYMTTGTYDFLKGKKDKYQEEEIILMQNAENTLLYHETNGKSVFSSPRKFEAIESKGTIGGKGYAVMNNIPVSGEGRPVFEYKFKNRAGMIENEPGFQAIRILRPIQSDTYVILTVWDDSMSFNNWKNSNSFSEAHQKEQPGKKTDASQTIFSGPSYVTQYTITPDTE
ncbi:antibiotic biosynthesis monooxygenase family protein [Peribacillus sp. B-H-3]|uniref:antibiotic biosynthesis monooxygenase family protein n=1 Tax=Peribacillus sp. B-H-3 TaxID=3400420 RepID=UPI003B01DD27